MLPWLLAAMIAGTSLDATTTHVAITQKLAREANPLLPGQPWAIDVVQAAGTAYAVVGVRSLWRDGHHTKAVLVTVAVTGAHVAATSWNMHQMRGHDREVP